MAERFDWVTEQFAVESIVGDEIDTSWHSSWHWERGKYGHLSLAGWQHALKDAEENCASARRTYERREKFLAERLRPLLKHLEQRKAESIAEEALAEATEANLPDAAVVDAVQKGAKP